MKAFVLSPHPDDEAIGCGGTLRKHVLAGDEVHVVFLTSGEGGGHGVEDAGTVREREAEVSGKIIGVTSTGFWRQRDGRVRADERTVARLTAELSAIQPDIVYVTHEKEMHPDHRAAVRLLRGALREASLRLEVRTYEVWTPLQDLAYIEDISDVIETKLEAVRAHTSQCNVMRFDDAVQGLNRYRGEMHSWPGGPYAEVFGELQWDPRG